PHRGMMRMKERKADENPATAGPATAMADDPVQRIAELEQSIASLKDQNLRLVAEMQNIQRRAQRDKEEALKFAESEFAKQLLVVLDGLERAQEAAKDASNSAAVADGVRIVHDHFLKILKDHHIETIDAEGQPFDPGLHEALMQQPSDQYPPGTVI